MIQKILKVSSITIFAASVLFIISAALPVFAGAATLPRQGFNGRQISSTRMLSSSSSAKISSSTRMAEMSERANQEIDQRVTRLTALISRVQGIRKLSDTEKTGFVTSIQNEISQLTALKNKIATDTDEATLRTDVQSITKSYRIYALIMPQTSILAAADRVLVITDAMTTISGKLQTRITSIGSAAFSLQSTLSDMNAKIADAVTQANAAESEVTGLVPDQGNQTQLQANTKALRDAQSKIKTATSDLKAARQDAGTIVKAIESLNRNTTSSNSQ